MKSLDFDEPRSRASIVGYTGHIHGAQLVCGATFTQAKLLAEEKTHAVESSCFQSVSGYSGERPGRKLSGAYGKCYLAETAGIRHAWEERLNSPGSDKAKTNNT